MKSGNNVYRAGLMLLMTIIASYVLAASCLLCGMAVSVWVFPCALLCSLTFCRNLRQLGLFSGGIVVALLFAMLTYDPSWDGIMYHQETIALLINGWNPYRPENLTADHSLWANHYAKAIEICASTVVATFGRLEIGKSINYILFFSTVYMVWSIVDNTFTGWRNLKKAAVTTAIVCNPVVICQLPTYYIDYTKYVYLLWTIILIYNLVTNSSRSNSIALAGVIILAISTKFNICFEEALWGLFAVVFLYATNRCRAAGKLLLIGAVGAVVGLIMSVHPYVTNFIVAGNPLYPLLGDGHVDIMTENTPDIFGHGRFIDFFISILTPNLPTNEARIGGFGPFMPIMLVCVICIIVRTWRQMSAGARSIMLFCFLSCFLFAQSWWARYTIQVWFLPAMALFLSYKYGKTPVVSKLLLWCMLLTIPVSMIQISRAIRAVYLYRTAIYESFEGDTIKLVHSMPQFERMLGEHGVSYERLDREPAETSGDIMYFYTAGLGREDKNEYPLIVLTEQQTAMLHENMKRTGRDIEYYTYRHGTAISD